MKIMLNKYAKGLFGLCLATLFFLSGCEEFDIREGIREVTFKVTADTRLVTAGESIIYKDSSLNVSNRLWTFEGGNVANSEQEEQEVIYAESGQFATTLEVSFTDGTQQERLFYVNIEPKVVAEFDANLRTIVVDGSVEYINLSTGLDNEANIFAINEGGQDEPVYSWFFEGGIPETSTQENPVVTYPSTGTFKVSLVSTRYAPENVNTVVKEGFINVVDVNVISPSNSTLTNFGSQINLEYPEGFDNIPAEELSNFSLLVDGEDSPLASLEIDPNDNKILILKPTNSITEDVQSIVVNYSGGALFAASGSLAAPIIELNINNSVVNLWNGNVDFEAGASGEFPPDWGTWNPTKGVNNNEFYMATDVEAFTGNQSLQISYDGSGDQWILDNKVPATIIPNGNYRVVFWAKASMDNVVFDLRTIESGWAAANDPDDFNLTTEWTQYSFDFVADDAGNLNRKIWWQLPGSMETFQVFVDDLKLYYLD